LDSGNAKIHFRRLHLSWSEPEQCPSSVATRVLSFSLILSDGALDGSANRVSLLQSD
jgi:hypothetical protein